MEYQLKNGDCTATVSTTGAEMTSFRKGGVSVGWEGNPDFWASRAPHLFPVCSGVKNGQVSFGGKPYPMKKHGFTRAAEFAAVSAADSKVELELRESAETMESFPYPFSLAVIHELGENGYATTYRVRNTGDAPMAFCIGGHPGFCVPMGGDGAFEDYRLVFEHTENAAPLVVNSDELLEDTLRLNLLQGTDTLPLRYSDFEADAMIFDKLKSRRVRLVHKDSGKGIAFDFTGFPVLGVWTPPGKRAPFLCLEPWVGMTAWADETGRFEDKPHAVKLAAGAEFAVGYRVEIL